MGLLPETEGDEEEHNFQTMLTFLIRKDGGPKSEGMSRDVFRIVLDMLMPSWDPLRCRISGLERTFGIVP